MTPQPLVSIIIRCSERDKLALTLASIAQQEYPNIEVIIVGMTGGQAPEMPDLTWGRTLMLRTVATDSPISRPLAAQAGLDECRGEFFCVLDEGDTLLAQHLSTLVPIALSRMEALVVHSRANLLNADGSVRKVLGSPLNRVLLYYAPLISLQACLIRNSVRELGCGFDPALLIAEDRDFLCQIAECGDFAHVDAITVNCSHDSDESPGRRFFYDHHVRAKWAGPAVLLSRRATLRCREGFAAYARGEREGARMLFEKILLDYPDDPNASHALGRIYLESGLLSDAFRCAQRAVEINPAAAEFQFTLAQVCEANGKQPEAIAAANEAVLDGTYRDAALALIRRLGTVKPQSNPVAPQPSGATLSRNAPCHCGSSKRFKDCHGALGAPALTSLPAENAPVAGPSAKRVEPAPQIEFSESQRLAMSELERIQHLWQRGEALVAYASLQLLDCTQLTTVDAVMSAADMHFQLGFCKSAFDVLYQLDRFPETRAGTALRELVALRVFRPRSNASVAKTIEKVLQAKSLISDGASGQSRRASLFHVVAPLSGIGGVQSLALQQAEVLSSKAEVHVWSIGPPNAALVSALPVLTLDAASGNVPVGGTLVVAGTHFELGPWLAASKAERITLAINTDAMPTALERITDIQEALPTVQLELTVPSRGYGVEACLPDTMVEYPGLDIVKFAPRARIKESARRFTLGRHGRDVPSKHHPNDPAFYRSLMAEGYEVKLMGGISQRAAFKDDGDVSRLHLLAVGSSPANDFIASLDCWVYRTHPNYYETFGIAVVEAMAMAVPVVLFGENVGAAELITHGVDGFLVRTESEALDIIRNLANDPGFAARIGDAARQRVARFVDEQLKTMTNIYLR